MDDELRRWMDDPSIDPELRDDLAHASEVVPPIDVSAGLARLNEAIHTGGGGAAGGSGGAAGWIAGAVIVAAIVGVAIWALLGDDEGRAPARMAPPSEAVAHNEGTPTDTPAEPALEPATIAPDDETRGDSPAVVSDVAPRAIPPGVRAGRGSPAPRAMPARPRPRQTETTEVDPLREEMALLARARGALATDPGRALALADEGQARFPEGLFGEEREAIAVLASSALGRTEQARQRGERFLRAHPNGPFTERVRRAMDAP